MTKVILLHLVKTNDDLSNHIDEIQEAIDKANRNLYGRFGIFLRDLEICPGGFLIKMTYPDNIEIKNVGIRLKGISQYLLKHYPFYKDCLVGTRLFTYNIIKELK